MEVDKGAGFTRGTPAVWQQYLPVRIEAMALTRDTLFAAGPPDVLKPDDPLGALEGRLGGVLLAIDPTTGEQIVANANPQPAPFRRHVRGRQSPVPRHSRREVDRLGMNHRLRYSGTSQTAVKLCHRLFDERLGRKLLRFSVGGRYAHVCG